MRSIARMMTFSLLPILIGGCAGTELLDPIEAAIRDNVPLDEVDKGGQRRHCDAVPAQYIASRVELTGGGTAEYGIDALKEVATQVEAGATLSISKDLQVTRVGNLDANALNMALVERALCVRWFNGVTTSAQYAAASSHLYDSADPVFKAESLETPSMAQDRYYHVQSLVSHLFLDVYGGGTKPGTDVVQAARHPLQVWKLIPAEKSGFFYLQSKVNNLFLDVYGASKELNGNVVVASQHPEQVWKLRPADTKGYFYVESQVSGYDLAVFQRGQGIGASVVQDARSPRQVWRFIPAD